ncbi:hypothetical protein PV05_02251 [Exophiala xenobiotica]|uniref:Uncharacterized protein n=1 Tax=Exophiala xenobiotica TaxID=348802 RepID=A0A0D2ESH2_9EURO|nr:uncharacterized protein PV05_02251 [Exophiala xenobiotica]KIW57685.1 hypothetical protein PV05_02251 [Exophiala xenobiotica]
MSVLTVSGITTIPDPTLSYDYPRSHPPNSTLPPHPAHSPPPGSSTRPDRKSYTLTTNPQLATAPGISNHKHSRTISSTTIPAATLRNPSSSPATHPTSGHSRFPSSSHSRQSSTSTSQNMNMHRHSTTASANSIPRRSTSGRSTSTDSPTSYVTLMRKQKATVWCDRSQNIDPRLAAAHKAAKQRAALEVQAVNNSGRTSTLSSGGVVGKIRHGGVPKAPGYVPANLNGASVPLRLSANEMLGDEEEGQSLGDNSMRHARTGSGRSSTNSAKYRSGYPRPDQGRFSTTSTPPSGEASPSRGIPEDSELGTPARKSHDNDDEDSFGELKDLSGPSSVQRALDHAKQAEDLRRRGSVDERTMSMGAGVRLFVANPDIED